MNLLRKIYWGFFCMFLNSDRNDTNNRVKMLSQSFQSYRFGNNNRIIKIKPYDRETPSEFTFDISFDIEYAIKEHFYLGLYPILSDFEKNNLLYPIGKKWENVKIPSILKYNEKEKILAGNLDKIYQTFSQILVVFVDCFQKEKKSEKILRVYFNNSIEEAVKDLWNFLIFFIWGENFFECCVFDHLDRLNLITKTPEQQSFNKKNKEANQKTNLYLNELYVNLLKNQIELILSVYETKPREEKYYRGLEITSFPKKFMIPFLSFVELKIGKHSKGETFSLYDEQDLGERIKLIEQYIKIFLSQKNSFGFYSSSFFSESSVSKMFSGNTEKYLKLLPQEKILCLSISNKLNVFFLDNFFFVFIQDKEISEFYTLKIFNYNFPITIGEDYTQADVDESIIMKKKEKFINKIKAQYFKTKITMPGIFLQNDYSFILGKKKTSLYEMLASFYKIEFLIKKYKKKYKNIIFGSVQKVSSEVGNKNLRNDFRYIMALFEKKKNF